MPELSEQKGATLDLESAGPGARFVAREGTRIPTMGTLRNEGREVGVVALEGRRGGELRRRAARVDVHLMAFEPLARLFAAHTTAAPARAHAAARSNRLRSRRPGMARSRCRGPGGRNPCDNGDGEVKKYVNWYV